jgi:hypothetical protein
VRPFPQLRKRLPDSVAPSFVEIANLMSKDDKIPEPDDRPWNCLAILQKSVNSTRVVRGDRNVEDNRCSMAERLTTIDHGIKALALRFHLPNPCVNPGAEKGGQELPIHEGQCIVAQRLPELFLPATELRDGLRKMEDFGLDGRMRPAKPHIGFMAAAERASSRFR